MFRLEEVLLDSLKLFVVPEAKTLSRILRQHFPDALAISYIKYRIIVELEETSPREYEKRLALLPNAIIETEVGIRYNYGLIVINGKEMRLLKQPDPTHTEEHEWKNRSSITP